MTSEFWQKTTIVSITLASIMGVSCIMPTLPLLSQVFEIELHHSGLVLIVLTLPGVFLSPLAGVMADRVGRKQILVPALILHALASAACFFTQNFDQLLFCTLLQGIGAAPLLMLYGTIIGDLYHGMERIKVLGLNATALSVGAALFPLVGGILADYNWRLPFLLPLVGLPVAWAASRLHLPKPDTQQSLRVYLDHTVHLLQNRRILALFVLSLGTFTTVYSGLLTGVPYLAHLRFDAPSSLIGIVLASSAAGTAMGAFFLSRCAGRFPPRTFLFISYSCHIIAFTCIPLMTGLWWLALPMLIYGWGQGFVAPSIYGQLMQHTPEESRAAIMALNATIIRGSQVLGPLLSGFLLKRAGLESIFLTSSAMALGMFLLVYFFITSEK